MTEERNAYRQIWTTVAASPEGCVATYGQVAALAGQPRRARFVGQALRHAPDTLKLPWHRVVNARGTLSFPVGSPPYEHQMDRLAEEGVEFIDGRIDLQHFGWNPSLDELLWKPDAQPW
jgi:methylated-DNA-protein-cysteine methyltransferase-like protein